MVFESLYESSLIARKAIYAFFIGLSFSVFGITFALFLFPEVSGLMSVAFVTILLIPTVMKLLRVESKQAAYSEKLTILQTISYHFDIYKFLFFLFLGILLPFVFFSIVLPKQATLNLFAQQLSLLGEVQRLSFDLVFLNNFKVFLLTFIAAVVASAGAIFFIIWNASVWGALFGFVIRESGMQSTLPKLLTFGLAIFPHMLFEVSGYFLAVVAGALVSEAIVSKRLGGKKTFLLKDAFNLLLLGVFFLAVGSLVEVAVTNRVILGLV